MRNVIMLGLVSFFSDISAEMKAITQYEKHISLIKNEEIIALLQRIILDEQMHVETLSELYRKYT